MKKLVFSLIAASALAETALALETASASPANPDTDAAAPAVPLTPAAPNSVPPITKVPKPPSVPAAGIEYNLKQLQMNADQLAENARLAAEVMIGSPSTRKPLFIPASQQSAEAGSETVEEMTIMSRILGKAVSHDEPKGRAMGIFVRMPSQGASRDMYIEGQGAVFFLNVGFPLAPARTDKRDQVSSAKPSEWDETKREVTEPQHGSDFGSWTGAPGVPTPPVEFDREKVEDLETRLISALTNAVHIQALKPNETITLVVASTTTGGGFGYVPQRTIRTPSARRPAPDSESHGTDVIRVPSPDDEKKGAKIEVLHARAGGSSSESKLIVRAKRKDLEKLIGSNASPAALRQAVTAFIF